MSAALELFRSQPYLGMSLLMLAVLAAGLAADPAGRRAALLAGTLSTPFCLYEVVFIPEYWNPVQPGVGAVGLADPIFSFATGGIAWLLATRAQRHTVFTWEWRRFLRRFIGGSLLGVVCSTIIWRKGVRVDIAVLIFASVGVLVLCWRYKRFHSFSLLGGLGFTIFYVLILNLSFYLSPDFIKQWNFNNLSGRLWLGLPAEDVLWALAFGAVWPRFIAYCFDARPAGAEA